MFLAIGNRRIQNIICVPSQRTQPVERFNDFIPRFGGETLYLFILPDPFVNRTELLLGRVDIGLTLVKH